MSRLTQSPAWKALQAHQQQMAGRHLRELFRDDPRRFEKFSASAAGLFLDYSKNLVTGETLSLLLDLTRQAQLSSWIDRMFRGERVNDTENRAALHTALRGNAPVIVDGEDVMPEVRRVLEQMEGFSQDVRNGMLRGYSGHPFTDVVNIGIGGSDLGPCMVTEALKPFSARPQATSYPTWTAASWCRCSPAATRRPRCSSSLQDFHHSETLTRPLCPRVVPVRAGARCDPLPPSPATGRK